jgi:hypothetical protein
MADDKPADTTDDFIHGWRLSPRIFRKPEQIHDVLKCFGPQRRRSTLRKIIQELEMIAVEYRVAQQNKPLKFEEAEPMLERFENALLKTNKQWHEKLHPLHPAFIALTIKMIRPNERKQKAGAAMASINLGLVATTLLRITNKLRVPKVYAAALRLPRGKSVERAFLWEPLLRLMTKYHAKPGQHGSFLGATKSLHLAIGIRPPSEGAIKKMRHDLRQAERSKQLKGYATVKKRLNA